MKLALIGFGNVGQGLLSLLDQKAADLQTRYAFAAQVVAVANSRGSVYDPNGLDIRALLDSNGTWDRLPDSPTLERNRAALDLIANSTADVVIEITPTDITSGQPALDHCRTALQNGKHVITANKGPIALAYAELRALAAEKGLRLGIEGTVMSGTPSMMLGLEALAGNDISEIRGILNGTTNYILTQMEAGQDYAEALKQAQDLGYAEADPTADVEGYDAMSKVIILANTVMGGNLKPEDIPTTGISQLTAADIQAAQAAGERWKLIGSLQRTESGIQARVAPERLPLSHPLAGVMGSTNAITYTTDIMGAVTLIGAGAGKTQTGFSILADLLAIAR